MNECKNYLEDFTYKVCLGAGMIVQLVKYLYTYEDLGAYPSSHVKRGTAVCYHSTSSGDQRQAHPQRWLMGQYSCGFNERPCLRIKMESDEPALDFACPYACVHTHVHTYMCMNTHVHTEQIGK